jgi:hypothetical protein
MWYWFSAGNINLDAFWALGAMPSKGVHIPHSQHWQSLDFLTVTIGHIAVEYLQSMTTTMMKMRKWPVTWPLQPLQCPLRLGRDLLSEGTTVFFHLLDLATG